ncbi:MAG: hypothetical protein LBD17_06430 [Endomicrobium sp.]|jgi:hypothetical protein|nr:hypothetical protein [Endomicrobium sp.]
MNKTRIVTVLFVSFFVYIFSCGQKDKVFRQSTTSTVPQTTEIGKTQNFNTHPDNVVAMLSQEVNNTSPHAISEFIQRLQDLGYSTLEIRELTKIKSENYGLVLREIMFNGGHFYYEGFDIGETPNNCSIYAVRRKLKHMYDMHMLPDETVWYRLSDRQMRNLIATGPNAEPGLDRGYIYRGESLDCEDIVNLQIYMGIPIENCTVLKTNGFRFIHLSQVPDGQNPFSIVLHRDNIIAIDPNPPTH